LTFTETVVAESQTGNRILDDLRPEELEQITPHLRRLVMESGKLLYMPDQKIEHIYFPIHGMISLLATLEGGASVEAGVVGNEGVVGISAVLGVELAATEALVQVEGEAFQMKAAALWPLIRNGGSHHDSVLRYTHTFFCQVTETSARKRSHCLNKRL